MEKKVRGGTHVIISSPLVVAQVPGKMDKLSIMYNYI